MGRVRGALGVFLASLILLGLGTFVVSEDVNLSKVEIAERERQFAKIVDILSSIVDSLTGKNKRVLQPSPSPSSTPSSTPAASRSPATSRSPAASPIPAVSPTRSSSPSPKPPVPSKTPSQFPTPSPSPKKPYPSSESSGLIIEEDTDEAPDKPGSTHFSGVPYVVFDYDAPSGKTERAVILVHGLNGEAKDMVPIMDAIREGMFPNTRFVIPEANSIYLTHLDSKVNSWFNVLDPSMNGPTDKESQIHVATNIDKVGDHLARDGVDRRKIVIIGYGQGSTVALTSYLRHEWGGMLGIAGFLSMADSYPSEMSDASETAPGVVVSGELDKIVSADAMRATAEKLEELGRDVSYIEIEDAGHDVITNERIPALAAGLLNRVFATEH